VLDAKALGEIAKGGDKAGEKITDKAGERIPDAK
jgi:hypothetical protein